FNVIFPRALFSKARHVTIPHCFNLEDETSAGIKDRIEAKWHAVPWLKKYLFWPWVRWISDVDLRLERCVYPFGYTFDQPSSWAKTSIDVSHLISIEAFRATRS